MPRFSYHGRARSTSSLLSPYGFSGRVAAPSAIGTTSGSPYTPQVDEKTNHGTAAASMAARSAKLPPTFAEK